MRAWMTQPHQSLHPTPFIPVPHGTVQRRCACGGVSGPDGECTECKRKRLAGVPASGEMDTAVPPSVHEVLSGTGRPLDEADRSGMESRFGHDFRQVRVFSGERAAQSAREIGAEAYTVGQRVVFGSGVGATRSQQGQQLLAHELAHVVQQRDCGVTTPTRVGREDGADERQATEASRQLSPGGTVDLGQRLPSANGQVQRQANPDQQLNITIGENGKLDLSWSGPKMPAVGNPTIGLRRSPDGRYDLLVGGTGKTVAAGEIPGLLRGAMGQSAKPGQVAGSELRVPTCEQMRGPYGGFMNFREYNASQMLSTKRMPLTPAFYDALVETCRPKPMELDVAPENPPQEAVPPVSPEGTAVA